MATDTYPSASTTRKQRRERRRQRRIARENKNPLYSPSVQLSGNALASTARQLAGLEIAPQLRGLDRQTQTVTQQGGALAQRAARYYETLGGRSDAGRAAVEAISSRLNEQLAAINTDAQAAVATAAAGEQGRLQADEQARGPGLQGAAASMAAAEAAAIASRAAESGQVFRSEGALQGARQEGLLAGIAGAGQLQGAETQREILGRQQGQLGDIAAQRAAVKAQRGPLTTKYLTDLRQTGFENLITQRGLRIDQQQIAQDAAEARRAYELAVRRATETERGNRADERQAAREFASDVERDAYQRLNQLGPYKPASDSKPNEPAASVKFKGDIADTIQRFTNLLGRGVPIDKAAQRIAEADDARPLVIAAARELADFGYLTESTISALKIAGVRNLPKSWRDRLDYGGRT